VGLGLLIVIEVSSSHTHTHTHTHHSIVLPWTRDRTVAKASTWQHITLTQDRHPRHRRDSNPQSHQASNLRPTS